MHAAIHMPINIYIYICVYIYTYMYIYSFHLFRSSFEQQTNFSGVKRDLERDLLRSKEDPFH